jgi:hypothetical protein
MSEIRPPVIIEDDEVREIWAEVMREMSRHEIETKLSKWELVFLVREIHRGEEIPQDIIDKRESAVDSLITRMSEERKNG